MIMPYLFCAFTVENCETTQDYIWKSLLQWVPELQWVSSAATRHSDSFSEILILFPAWLWALILCHPERLCLSGPPGHPKATRTWQLSMWWEGLHWTYTICPSEGAILQADITVLTRCVLPSIPAVMLIQASSSHSWVEGLLVCSKIFFQQPLCLPTDVFSFLFSALPSRMRLFFQREERGDGRWDCYSWENGQSFGAFLPSVPVSMSSSSACNTEVLVALPLYVNYLVKSWWQGRWVWMHFSHSCCSAFPHRNILGGRSWRFLWCLLSPGRKGFNSSRNPSVVCPLII